MSSKYIRMLGKTCKFCHAPIAVRSHITGVGYWDEQDDYCASGAETEVSYGECSRCGFRYSLGEIGETKDCFACLHCERAFPTEYWLLVHLLEELKPYGKT